MWLVVKDAILTWNNLQKRGWSGPTIYSQCRSSEGTITHIIIHSEHSKLLWARFAQQFNFRVNPTPPPNIWGRIHSSRGRWKIHDIVIVALCWNIWKERKRRIFIDVASSCDCCMLFVHDDVISWTWLLSDEKRVCLLEDDLFEDL